MMVLMLLQSTPSGDIILLGHYCMGVYEETCEMNISSFTLTKENLDSEGDAFVGRFSVVLMET